MDNRFVDSEYFILPALAGFMAACVLWGWLYFTRIEPHLRARTERQLDIKIYRRRGNWAVRGQAGCRTELTVLALDMAYTIFILFGGIAVVLMILVVIGVLLRDVRLL